jgi:hypothetical protein
MRLPRNVVWIPFALVVLAVPLATSAGATTLVRQGLETLAGQNAMIVQGRVLDIHSYWNDDRGFILTDVRLRPTQVLKGERPEGDITFTVMGGTVGDITTLVIGNPELVPGSHYVLFLNRESLPGAATRLTVRDLVQGAFDVVQGRAISQAIHHGLVPDAAGKTEPPGGEEGIALDEMTRQIHQILGER